jgi:hypothetical protein
VLVCIRHCFLTVIKVVAFCLQKTAEARKSRKSGSDDELGIEELISGEGGGFGNLFTIWHEKFVGLTNIW